MTRRRTPRSTSLLTALLLVVASIVFCPCAPAPDTSADHDCCAGTGISALTACCQDGAVAHPGGIAAAAAPAAAPEDAAGAFEIVTPALPALLDAPAPAVFLSPPVLRI